MHVSDAINKLLVAKQRLGNVSLAHLSDNEICDIASITAMPSPSEQTLRCWTGPTIVVDLATNASNEMMLSTAISALILARKKLGGIDAELTVVRGNQFCDVTDLIPIDQPSNEISRCPVVVAVTD